MMDTSYHPTGQPRNIPRQGPAPAQAPAPRPSKAAPATKHLIFREDLGDVLGADWGPRAHAWAPAEQPPGGGLYHGEKNTWFMMNHME